MPNKNSHILQLVQHLQPFGEVILLESQKDDHLSNEKSLIAGKPKAWIKAKGNLIELYKNGKTEVFEKNPWEAVKEFSKEENSWLFGYLGYDLKNSIEKLESNNKSLSAAPDLFFMVPEILIQILKNGEVEVLLGTIPNEFEGSTEIEEFSFFDKECIDKGKYISKIKKAKEYILEGDFYEVNLSHSLSFNCTGNPLSLYEKMKDKGPVPFGAYIFMDGISICCASPERFLARRGNRVWSQPIKGTTSNNEKINEEEKERELKSEKNLAENLMIVDLVRNDLSRVAKRGSVKVKDLFQVQKFETVLQMVSTIEGEVESDQKAIDIIKACFPMGSMTGAPKIAAMNAIEELEDYKRGIYSGAIGYITPSQDFDFNVVIRTAIIEKNRLIYPVGGAITSDSDPLEEWEETLIKARALLSTRN